jgi:hypothetical protein
MSYVATLVHKTSHFSVIPGKHFCFITSWDPCMSSFKNIFIASAFHNYSGMRSHYNILPQPNRLVRELGDTDTVCSIIAQQVATEWESPYFLSGWSRIHISVPITAILNVDFRGFPSTCREFLEMFLKLEHDRILPYTFQFLNHE